LPELNSNTDGLIIYPCLNTKYGLCIDSDDKRSYMILNPGEEIIIPLYCKYRINTINSTIKKTITFDLRTSLYSDPVNYTFTVVAKNEASIQDKLLLKNKKLLLDRFQTPLKYNHTIK
jgi:hypothetical protein